MRCLPTILALGVAVGVFGVGSGTAVSADEPKAFLTAEAAGPDFVIQGEYLGTIGDKIPLGAQVLALGDGAFDAVFYAKGLPGSGWDGKTKVRLSGKTADGVTKLEGVNFKGEIAGGVFKGDGDGAPFELTRLERKSPTLGAEPPEGAVVLFDGKSASAWENGRITDDGLLMVGTRTKDKFSSYTLHLEFRTPYMPKMRGQARGNSGMYLNDQYECQVLDSFALTGENNECGGFYQIAKPAVNMAFPPLSWQTYDVEFQAATYDAQGTKVAPAIVTVKHNGVAIHDKFALPRNTPGGGQSDESKPGAIYLQDHGDPVHFRNIWIVPK